MPLEATVICLDGSEYMRNGDYIPTRLEAMKDAANLVCGVKIQMNAENSVGVVAGGTPLGPKVLCSCSQDMAALLSACANVKIGGGHPEFAKSLQVAALALKHRRNKNGGARIVAFIGSPLEEDEEKLIKIAKNFKKNNIAVDIVVIGEYEINEGKLKVFMENVDKNKNSNLVAIPAGILPSEVLMTSPIITGGEDGGDNAGGGATGGGAGAAAAAFAEYGGVDPSLDPELAMALRASLQEERARLEATQQVTAAPLAVAGEAATTTAAEQESNIMKTGDSTSSIEADENDSGGVGGTGGEDEDDEGDEDELLKQALLMSLSESNKEGTTKEQQDTHVMSEQAEDEDDEEASALALALALSQQEDIPETSTSDKPEASTAAAASTAPSQQQPLEFLDPSYVNELLEGIDGVNMDDPQIQALLAQYQGGTKPPDEGPDSKKQKKEDKE